MASNGNKRKPVRGRDASGGKRRSCRRYARGNVKKAVINMKQKECGLAVGRGGGACGRNVMQAGFEAHVQGRGSKGINNCGSIDILTNDEICGLLMFECQDRRTSLGQVLDCLAVMMLRRVERGCGDVMSLGEVLWYGPRVLRKRFVWCCTARLLGEVMFDERESKTRRVIARWVLESGGGERVRVRAHGGDWVESCELVFMMMRDLGHRRGWAVVQRCMRVLWGISGNESAALVDVIREGVWSAKDGRASF